MCHFTQKSAKKHRNVYTILENMFVFLGDTIVPMIPIEVGSSLQGLGSGVGRGSWLLKKEGLPVTSYKWMFPKIVVPPNHQF